MNKDEKQYGIDISGLRSAVNQFHELLNNQTNKAEANNLSEIFGNYQNDRNLKEFTLKLQQSIEFYDKGHEDAAQRTFNDVLKIRSYMMSSPAYRDTGTQEFLKNVVQRTTDGNAQASLALTRNLHDFVINSNNADDDNIPILKYEHTPH